jgi:hypothetical protein
MSIPPPAPYNGLSTADTLTKDLAIDAFNFSCKNSGKFPVRVAMYDSITSGEYPREEHYSDEVVAAVKKQIETRYYVVSVPATKDEQGLWNSLPRLLVYHPDHLPVSVSAKAVKEAAPAMPAAESSDMKRVVQILAHMQYDLKQLTTTTGAAAGAAASAALNSKMALNIGNLLADMTLAGQAFAAASAASTTAAKDPAK